MFSIDDVEELRERLHCETGLVVVGGGDDQLRVSISKQAAEGITQDIVDRCILVSEQLLAGKRLRVEYHILKWIINIDSDMFCLLSSPTCIK